jgi:hypothetical protein
MDHALEPHRQFAEGSGRAGSERLEEIAGQLHEQRLVHLNCDAKPYFCACAASTHE